MLERHNAEDIRDKAISGDYPELQFLPVLEKSGFIIKGFSHLVSGYPKSGKTTLLAPLSLDWSKQGDSVVYFTEEPEMAWAERLRTMQAGWGKVNLVFALGSGLKTVIETIKAGVENVVVVDTLRILGFSDENDNAEINRILAPLITCCREKNQTLVLAHHTRKTGGDYGTAAAGGHAIVGIVDIVLEVSRVPKRDERRRLRGWGRVVEIPDITYEFDGENLYVVESMTAIEEEALSLVVRKPRRTKEIWGLFENPKPSLRSVNYVLNHLMEKGKITRQPQDSRSGAIYLWSLP